MPVDLLQQEDDGVKRFARREIASLHGVNERVDVAAADVRVPTDYRNAVDRVPGFITRLRLVHHWSDGGAPLVEPREMALVAVISRTEPGNRSARLTTGQPSRLATDSRRSRGLNRGCARAR